MKKSRRRYSLISPLVIVSLLVNSVPFSTFAALSACSASVSPTSLNPNQAANLSFSITNNDGANAATWVKITSPSGNFQVNGGSSSGWSASAGSDSVTYTNGSLGSGSSSNFTVQVQTLSATPASSWTVQISDDAGGAAPTTCSGSTAVTISGDSTAPVISSIQATNLSATSATITWTTDEASNSRVDYGPTTSYGQNVANSTQTTSHSISVTGLTAATTYHFRVRSTDGANNTATSGDNVFTTSSQGDHSLTIGSISATNITTTGATITWQTNNTGNSRVDYGPTTSYGQNVTSSSTTTNHSLSVSELSPSTTYHYKVTTTDQIGNTLSSGDNTFTTAATSSGGSSGGGGGSGSFGGESGPAEPTTTTPPPTTTTTTSSSGSSGGGSGGSGSSGGGTEQPPPPPADTQPPAISLATDLSTPFSTAPSLSGTATDNNGVQSVSYSLDGGSNWLTGVSLTGSATNRTFSITPANSLQDGNYELRFRAFDAAGNLGLSPIYTLVIDQIPPLVGPSLYTIGAQDVVLDNLDTSAIVTGLDQRITLSAVGGATNIDIIARSRDGSGAEQVYSLVRNPDTGLWTGTVSLTDNGQYELIARAVDGAGNRTERTLRNLNAVAGGQLLHQDTNQPVEAAEVIIYHLNPLSHQFEVWDARPFGQTNPQISNHQGQFKALLPPGTYYILAQSDALRPTQTPIFHLQRNTPIQPVITMAPQNYLSLGPVRLAYPPRFLRQTVNLEITPPPAPVTSTLIGQPLPQTPIVQNGASLPLGSAITQPTIVTFLADWSPQASEQLHQLEMLQQQFPGQVVVVLTQSNPARADLLRRRGGYTLPLFTDPLGQLTADLAIDTTSTHLLVAPDGFIRHVTAGLKSSADLSAILTAINSSP